MPNQDFKLHPSVQYFVFLAVVVLVSVGIVLMLSLPTWARALLLALLAVYGCNLLYSNALLRGPFAIKRIKRLESGQWQLVFREARHDDPAIEKIGELTNDSVASSLLMVLRFKVPDERRPLSCIVFRDSLPADEYRQLRVLVKS